MSQSFALVGQPTRISQVCMLKIGQNNLATSHLFQHSESDNQYHKECFKIVLR